LQQANVTITASVVAKLSLSSHTDCKSGPVQDVGKQSVPEAISPAVESQCATHGALF
jgi:hypothetical protein